MISRKGF